MGNYYEIEEEIIFFLEEEQLFCPSCGSTLLDIAYGEITTNDEHLLKMLDSERLKKATLDYEKEGWKRFNIYFSACFKCKKLYLNYGGSGVYFDILGELSNDAIISFVSQHLSKKDE